MTKRDQTQGTGGRTDPSANDFEALAEQTQRVVQAFWERQTKEMAEPGFSIVDVSGVSQAFADFSRQLISNPTKFAEAQTRLWQDNVALLQNLQDRISGKEVDPFITVPKGDQRFSDKAWEEDIIYDYVKQAYLVSSQWIQSFVEEIEMDAQTKEKVSLYTRQFVSAMAPSNFALMNPTVLRETRETGGENLLKGFKNLLTDLEKGKGQLRISMTDDEAFEIGKNVAVTPGKVIYQTELMQLIQYAPSTDKVYKRPLLIVPPWINKFYILDLQPKNSFIKWVVDQGYTVFVISWVNPQESLADKSFEDYMLEGPVAALAAIEQAIGEKDINVLGFCIGGILTVATLAYLAACKDQRVKSATFLATMVNLKDVGEVSVFIDETQLQSLEKHVASTGYLEGHHMADMFSLMRENDLIWSFVVNNYLMGKDPIPFDLLYWNADSTRLPAAMLVFYLRKFYQQNLLMVPGGMTLADVPIDLGKIKTPIYSIATKDDHIAPWPSCYPLTQATSGPVRFVLGASGHIAGIVNPPARKKYGFWVNDTMSTDPEDWLAAAEAHEGSWWPDWKKWIRKQSGAKVAPRVPGEGGLEPVEEAPGSYVKVRMPN